MNMTEFSLKRPVTVIMMFICLATIGLISARLLPLEYFPDVVFPGMMVQIPYDNSTPEEVERRITRPIEEAMATLGDVKMIESISSDSDATLFIMFDWGANMAVKGIEARDKIDAVRNELPQDINRFIIQRFSTSDQPVLTLRLSADADLSESYEMLNRNVKRRIETLPGVSKVDLYGVDPKEIRIDLSADQIAAHNINMEELTRTLQSANFSMAAGQITTEGRRFSVHPIGEFGSIEDIGNLVIGEHGLRLAEIADITRRKPDLPYGRHLNRKYAIGLNVSKESGANLVEVSDRVLEEIEKIRVLPAMKSIRLYVMDNQGEGVRDSLQRLLSSGLIGAVLSILVLYFFLRSFVMTMIVTVAVPFSIIITLGILYFFGMSLNVLSLMGLMLSVGMLVDNSVVVTESIFRYRQLYPDDPVKSTLLGIDEVGTAVLAGTATTAIVFMPLIVGEKSDITLFMTHVAVPICFALFLSLLVSKTLIPLFTTRIKGNPVNEEDHMMQGMVRYYESIMRWTLSHRWWTSLGILLIIASTAIPLTFIKMDMFPNENSRSLFLRYNINSYYAKDKVEAAVDNIEAYLFANQDKFEIDSVYSFYTYDRAESTILLKDLDNAEKTAEEIKELIREGLPKIAVGDPSFDQNRGGGTEGVSLNITGPVAEGLSKVAGDVKWALLTVAGIKDVRVQANLDDREVQIKIDRERAQENGLTSQGVANVVMGALRGQRLKPFRSESGESVVRAQFQKSDRVNLDRILQMPVFNAKGERIELASVATITTGAASGSIQRFNREVAVKIGASLDGLTISEAKESIQKVMDNLNLPAGYGWNFGRSFDDEEEAMVTMLVNLLLALALVYLVMAALFESLLFPLSIITGIFFSFIGVFWFFLATNTTFTMMAITGMMILMGVVVNNGIVLIDHVNNLRAGGVDRLEAIIRGGKDRLRPILMTVGTTVLGLLPLAFSTAQIGGDGPAYAPMARAIVGGLVFSTVVSLIVLPSIYYMLDDLRNWASGIRREAVRMKFLAS